MEGERGGTQVLRLTDGTVNEGPINVANGNREGLWMQQQVDGDVAEIPYVDGDIHGTVLVRRVDGTVEEIRFIEGERQ